MGPMLVAIFVAIFYGLALVCACVGTFFAILVLHMARSRGAWLLLLYVIGSGLLGAAAAILFGLLQRWNVIGDTIFAQPLLGYAAWAATGFGLSTAASFVVGSFFRYLLRATPHRHGIPM